MLVAKPTVSSTQRFRVGQGDAVADMPTTTALLNGLKIAGRNFTVTL